MTHSNPKTSQTINEDGNFFRSKYAGLSDTFFLVNFDIYFFKIGKTLPSRTREKQKSKVFPVGLISPDNLSDIKPISLCQLLENNRKDIAFFLRFT